MLDDQFAPTLCLYCGGPMPTRRRQHGHPPKTCSDKCRKARASAREKERYHQVKSSAQWKETRALYLKRQKEFLEQNPFEREVFLKRARLSSQRHREQVMADPNAWEKVLSNARSEYRSMRAELAKQPMGLVAYRFKKRQWYNSLSAEDKQRIYGVKSND